MLRLTQIMHNIWFGMHSGYISEEGQVGSNPPSKPVVAYSYSYSDKPAMPKEIEDYLKMKGVWRLTGNMHAYETQLKLKRLSDGKEEIFTFTDFYIYFRKGDEKLFAELGLYSRYPKTLSAHGFQMQQEEYQKLAKFLREAGVKFEPDTPPWMEDVPKVKPSPDRPGMDAARFLGYV